MLDPLSLTKLVASQSKVTVVALAVAYLIIWVFLVFVVHRSSGEWTPALAMASAVVTLGATLEALWKAGSRRAQQATAKRKEREEMERIEEIFRTAGEWDRRVLAAFKDTQTQVFTVGDQPPANRLVAEGVLDRDPDYTRGATKAYWLRPQARALLRSKPELLLPTSVDSPAPQA